jgi:hypothetical protein
MVSFVATSFEAHVFVVASGAIYTWPYHKGDSGGIANYTRFSHLSEYRVTITLPIRGPGQGCLNGRPKVKFTVRTSAQVRIYPADGFLPSALTVK